MRTNKKFGLALIGFGILTNASTHAAPIVSTELPDTVEKVLPAVVNISATQLLKQQVPPGWEDFLQHWGVPSERPQSSLGSGFLIDAKEGFVLTNNHVVEHATEVIVKLFDKREFPAKIIGRDAKLDMALLQIRDENKKVPTGLHETKLADSQAVRIAEPVFAVGNPFGLQHTVTVGIVSAKNRSVGAGPLDNFLQTDAAINPGNSGGPLFNFKGEVIGMNTMIFSKSGQSGGIGFAIPINDAKEVLSALKQYGRVPRPWLGVLTERVTPQIAVYYQLPRANGVLVYNLVQTSPADKASLRQGDILISANGEKILEPLDLERVLTKLKPTDELKLELQRAGSVKTVKVKLQELPPRLDSLPKGII